MVMSDSPRVTAPRVLAPLLGANIILDNVGSLATRELAETKAGHRVLVPVVEYQHIALARWHFQAISKTLN